MSSVNKWADVSDGGEPLTGTEQRLMKRAWAVVARGLERDPEGLERATPLPGGLKEDEDNLSAIAVILELDLGLHGIREDVADWTTVDDILKSVLRSSRATADDAGAA
ncbi:hypothetical protein LRE75_22600 [Streptomyces sp. 372A]